MGRRQQATRSTSQVTHPKPTPSNPTADPMATLKPSSPKVGNKARSNTSIIAILSQPELSHLPSCHMRHLENCDYAVEITMKLPLIILLTRRLLDSPLPTNQDHRPRPKRKLTIIHNIEKMINHHNNTKSCRMTI
jgi:hypothetical protein